ncbi:MAG: hypothetical protein AB2687_01755 [Candidatus Thiodiazotropha taylori]
MEYFKQLEIRAKGGHKMNVPDPQYVGQNKDEIYISGWSPALGNYNSGGYYVIRINKHDSEYWVDQFPLNKERIVYLAVTENDASIIFYSEISRQKKTAKYRISEYRYQKNGGKELLKYEIQLIHYLQSVFKKITHEDKYLAIIGEPLGDQNKSAIMLSILKNNYLSHQKTYDNFGVPGTPPNQQINYLTNAKKVIISRAGNILVLFEPHVRGSNNSGPYYSYSALLHVDTSGKKIWPQVIFGSSNYSTDPIDLVVGVDGSVFVLTIRTTRGNREWWQLVLNRIKPTGEVSTSGWPKVIQLSGRHFQSHLDCDSEGVFVSGTHRIKDGTGEKSPRTGKEAPAYCLPFVYKYHYDGSSTHLSSLTFYNPGEFWIFSKLIADDDYFYLIGSVTNRYIWFEPNVKNLVIRRFDKHGNIG